jgi:hypothetical protein
VTRQPAASGPSPNRNNSQVGAPTATLNSAKVPTARHRPRRSPGKRSKQRRIRRPAPQLRQR